MNATSSRAAALDRSLSSGYQPYPIDHADEFDERLRRALENPRLRGNLTAFQQGWRTARDRAADEIDFSTLQTWMKRAKSSVTANLEQYLDEFRGAGLRHAEASAHGPTAAAARVFEVAGLHVTRETERWEKVLGV